MTFSTQYHKFTARWYLTITEGPYNYTDIFDYEPTAGDMLRTYAYMIKCLDETSPGWREHS